MLNEANAVITIATSHSGNSAAAVRLAPMVAVSRLIDPGPGGLMTGSALSSVEGLNVITTVAARTLYRTFPL
jgi:hypothetical protein